MFHRSLGVGGQWWLSRYMCQPGVKRAVKVIHKCRLTVSAGVAEDEASDG